MWLILDHCQLGMLRVSQEQTDGMVDPGLCGPGLVMLTSHDSGLEAS